MIDRNAPYSLNHSRHFESLESDTHGLDDLMPFKRLCKLIKYYSCEETFRHKILFYDVDYRFLCFECNFSKLICCISVYHVNMFYNFIFPEILRSSWYLKIELVFYASQITLNARMTFSWERNIC